MKVITASSKCCNKVCELFEQCMSEYRAGVVCYRWGLIWTINCIVIILKEEQAGFRPNRSMQDLLHRTIDVLKTALDLGYKSSYTLRIIHGKFKPLSTSSDSLPRLDNPWEKTALVCLVHRCLSDEVPSFLCSKFRPNTSLGITLYTNNHSLLCLNCLYQDLYENLLTSRYNISVKN